MVSSLVLTLGSTCTAILAFMSCSSVSARGKTKDCGSPTGVPQSDIYHVSIRPSVGIIQIRLGRGRTPSSQPTFVSSLESVFLCFILLLRAKQAGRSSLAPSHAGTRLPLASVSAQGAPPRPPISILSHPFCKRKSEDARSGYLR